MSRFLFPPGATGPVEALADSLRALGVLLTILPRDHYVEVTVQAPGGPTTGRAVAAAHLAIAAVALALDAAHYRRDRDAHAATRAHLADRLLEAARERDLLLSERDRT